MRPGHRPKIRPSFAGIPRVGTFESDLDGKVPSAWWYAATCPTRWPRSGSGHRLLLVGVQWASPLVMCSVRLCFRACAPLSLFQLLYFLSLLFGALILNTFLSICSSALPGCSHSHLWYWRHGNVSVFDALLVRQWIYPRLCLLLMSAVRWWLSCLSSPCCDQL